MKIITWAAVAITALFVLMNAGAALDPEQAAWVRAFGAVVGVAGVAALVGLATGRGWGRPAVIAVGALNVAGSIAALVDGQEGGLIGLVVGCLGVLLGALAGSRTSHPATA